MKLPPVDLPNVERETIRKAIEVLRAAMEKELEDLRRRVHLLGG
jgi:hypothetical protein